jgi:hypothetical protein
MLSALGDLGDFIGGIGVIVTLIYLAIQIRRNTEQTRLNTAGESWSGILAAFEPAYYGDNIESFQRGLAGELDPSGADYLTFAMLMVRTMGQFEMSLYQARQGALDDELLAMHSRLAQTLITTPGGRRWWDGAGSALFGRDFVGHIEAILASPDDGILRAPPEAFGQRT